MAQGHARATRPGGTDEGSDRAAGGEAAEGASHKRTSHPQARFQRSRHRRGPKRAVCAAALLTAAHHVLRDGTLYHDLGPGHFHPASRGSQTKSFAKQITKPGFTWQIAAATPVAVVSV